MLRDASEVTVRNDYRTRYINYFVRKNDRIVSNAIVNIVGGSAGANEESERIKVLIGSTQVPNEEMDGILGLGKSGSGGIVTTIYYNPLILPLVTIGSPYGPLVVDGSSNLYNISTGTSVSLTSPITYITTDSGGRVYVADSSNIYEYISPGTFINMNITGLSNITSFTASSSNMFFVLEDGSSQIYGGPSNSASFVLAGSTPGFTDASGTSAQFNRPMSIALDPTEQYLYVADTFNSMIRQMVSTAPYTVSTLAGNTIPYLSPFPTDNVGNRDGNGLYGESLLYEPHGLTVSPSGIIYIADTNNHNIRSLTNGNLVTIAGEYGIPPIYDVSPPGYADGPANQSRWLYPISISYYNSTLYISEPLNHAVRTLTVV